MRFLILMMAIMVAACSPEQRLARLVKKNPQLVQMDTGFVNITVQADSVSDSLTFNRGPIASDVDSLTDKFTGKVSGPVLDSLNKGFKELLKKGDIDTTITTDKGKFSIVSKNGRTTINATLQPEPFDTLVPVVINTVNPPAVNNIFDRFTLKIAHKLEFWLFIIILLYIGYRVAKNKFFS
jgi:hypothetical protein